MYFVLKNSYRNEYYFKNTLFNQLVKHYGLENSVVLDEFKIGGSIADFVFLNGEARVYEIKTAFDDLSKLKKAGVRLYAVCKQSLYGHVT